MDGEDSRVLETAFERGFTIACSTRNLTFLCQDHLLDISMEIPFPWFHSPLFGGVQSHPFSLPLPTGLLFLISVQADLRQTIINYGS